MGILKLCKDGRHLEGKGELWGYLWISRCCVGTA